MRLRTIRTCVLRGSQTLSARLQLPQLRPATARQNELLMNTPSENWSGPMKPLVSFSRKIATMDEVRRLINGQETLP